MTVRRGQQIYLLMDRTEAGVIALGHTSRCRIIIAICTLAIRAAIRAVVTGVRGALLLLLGRMMTSHRSRGDAQRLPWRWFGMKGSGTAGHVSSAIMEGSAGSDRRWRCLMVARHYLMTAQQGT